jgi:hypothetical protein
MSHVDLTGKGEPRNQIFCALNHARRTPSPLRTKKNREASRPRKQKIKAEAGPEEGDACLLKATTSQKAHRKQRKSTFDIPREKVR